MAATDPGALGAVLSGPVASGDWLVIAPVVIAIAAGALLLMLRHHLRWQAAYASGCLLLMLAANAALLVRVLSDGPLVMTMGRWLPPFGISFAADALGASFAVVATFVALICALSSARDIDTTGRRYGFYPFLMLMMAGVNGAFLTGDIFNLYVWFEVFLIASFGLLILGSEPAQIDGATKYGILNLLATALFLIATAYLYGAFGTLNMADIAVKAAGLRGSAPLMTIATLYLLAFGMKAAAFPVNFWLPAAYHTPRLVTAALFGGLLTKIGVYALLRSLVMIFPVERAALSEVIEWVAILTMICGVMGALAQTDVRRMFGFLVISGVGIMLAGLALGSPLGVSGTILYAVHSMLVMSALYLLAGAMREMGGSFLLTELGGIYRKSTFLTAVALLIFLAAAGLPPGSGLWPKVMLAKAAIDGGGWLLAGAILATGFMTSIALGRVFVLAFWRDAQKAGPVDSTIKSVPRLAIYAPLVSLTIPIVVLGIIPEQFIRIAELASAGLIDVTAYVRAVFPAGGS
ncbi:Na+/H+ antiporter subunit D [Mesorhizobium sp. KR9-304]|uniref:Na+/H+ antiporter subunit D n=1 Tax=Mesorhizobium sp. KR9-304 TaxID=3156614 RepID=UPI0032B4D454